MPAEYENLVEKTYGTILLRVWFRRSPEEPSALDHTSALHAVCDPLLSGKLQWSDPLDLARLIGNQLPDVNAIQVTLGLLGTSIYYPDWP